MPPMPSPPKPRIDLPYLPFVIDVVGQFPPDRLQVAFDPAPRPTTPDLDRLIAAEWDRQMALAKEHDRLLFNGELFRYVDHRVADDAGSDPTFHLTVGPTCYRDFVGTNLYNHHRLAEFGWHRFSNPIGTTATLVTADGRICYGRRSARVAYHAGHVHTFGGGLEKRDRRPDGTIDPFDSLCRELAEELNLRRSELSNLFCAGLVRDREIHQPELLFEAELSLSYGELNRRWETAEARHEHDELVDLNDAPDAIVPFIAACDLIAPVAVGALFLHGRRRWGDRWLNEAANAYRAALAEQ